MDSAIRRKESNRKRTYHLTAMQAGYKHDSLDGLQQVRIQPQTATTTDGEIYRRETNNQIECKITA